MNALRRWPWLSVLAAAIAAVPSAYAQVPQVGVWTESMSLGSLVERAKRDGRSEVSLSVPIIDHTPVPASIGRLLDGKTIIIATAERPQAARAFVRMESAPDILTWHVLRVEQVLAREAPADSCMEPPRDLTSSRDEVFAHVLGGTIIVDGIRVTQRTLAPQVVESGRRYLLIGNPCRDGDRVFPGGGYAFWQISDSGALEPQDNRQWEVFRAFPRLASVATISAYLQERKTQRIEKE